MPAYDYRCPECGNEEERKHTIAECDKPQLCTGVDHVETGVASDGIKEVVQEPCGAALERLISSDTFATKDRRMQMNAIMSDGSHVPGQFGKTERSFKGRGYGEI